MMNDDAKKRLDIGCGRHKVEGTIGLDFDVNSHAEIIHD